VSTQLVSAPTRFVWHPGRDRVRTARTDDPPRASPTVKATPVREEPPAAATRRREGVATDTSAVGPTYERHARLVYARALAILRLREDAEDLTQEVFLNLCGSAAYDPERGSMSAFLTTVTRSRALDRLRERRRSACFLETWRDAPPAAPAPAMPWEQVSMRRTAERVRAALAALPRVQRQVLEMAYDRGLTQREIARELGAPLGSVKSWSRRALLALGQTLEDCRA
jgi:RNA polymerase sigma-70 factor, ECF subfamily